MVSRIASGLSLVNTFTTCLKWGDSARMGDRFNLLVSPAIINCNFDPYLAVRRWLDYHRS